LIRTKEDESSETRCIKVFLIHYYGKLAKMDDFCLAGHILNDFKKIEFILIYECFVQLSIVVPGKYHCLKRYQSYNKNGPSATIPDHEWRMGNTVYLELTIIMLHMYSNLL